MYQSENVLKRVLEEIQNGYCTCALSFTNDSASSKDCVGLDDIVHILIYFFMCRECI